MNMEETHGHAWGHDSDKALLQFLQAFSAQLDAQMSACRRSLDDLAQSATDVTTDLARVGTAVSLLSNARFIEKQVEEPEDLFMPQPLSAAPSGQLSPRDAAQAAKKRQAQALQQALAAVMTGDRAPRHARPLPHIYGSAEYLQDSQAGLGSDDVPATEAAVPRGDTREAFISEPESSPLTSDGEASELESLRNFSQAGAPGRLPDFRSMLEAALRGDIAPGPPGAPWLQDGDGGPPATARSTRSLGGFSELWSASEVAAHTPYRRSSTHRPSGGSSAAQSPAGPPRLQRTSSTSAATSGPADAAHVDGAGSGTDGGGDADAAVSGAAAGAARAGGRGGDGETAAACFATSGSGSSPAKEKRSRARVRRSSEATESMAFSAGTEAAGETAAASSGMAVVHDAVSHSSEHRTRQT